MFVIFLKNEDDFKKWNGIFFDSLIDKKCVYVCGKMTSSLEYISTSILKQNLCAKDKDTFCPSYDRFRLMHYHKEQ